MLSFFGLLFNLGAASAVSIKESHTPKTPAVQGMDNWNEVLGLMVGKSPKEAERIFKNYAAYHNATKK